MRGQIKSINFHLLIHNLLVDLKQNPYPSSVRVRWSSSHTVEAWARMIVSFLSGPGGSYVARSKYPCPVHRKRSGILLGYEGLPRCVEVRTEYLLKLLLELFRI
jgi:hypothetical protein